MIYSVEIKRFINVILSAIEESAMALFEKNLLTSFWKEVGFEQQKTEDCIDFVMRLKSQSLRDSSICLYKTTSSWTQWRIFFRFFAFRSEWHPVQGKGLPQTCIC